MAGPVAHIVIALQMFNNGLLSAREPEDLVRLIVGTSFPDIRYTTKLSRKTTHPGTATLQQIRQERNPFKAGMDLHDLVDRVRWYYIHKHKVLDMLPQHPRTSLCLKLFEGQLLRNQVEDWATVHRFFNHITPEERTFNLPEKKIKEWHELIQYFCSSSPPNAQKLASLYFMIQFQSKFFKLPAKLRNLMATLLAKLPLPIFLKTRRFMKTLGQNEHLKQTILYFYDNFLQIAQEYEASL